MTIRAKMCQNKVSFRTKDRARMAAEEWGGQRVYECPICFCWHCTSKENWKEDFVTKEEMERKLKALECEIRREYNEILRRKNRRISELDLRVKRLRMGYDDN